MSIDNFEKEKSEDLWNQLPKTVRDVLFECHRTVVPFSWAVRPYSRLLTGIPTLAVFQNLRWNSNKTSLCKN